MAGFSFNTEDEWREFRIGAWLHDCGKVTTPEYVVDKATKLETVYNRIHEVRMRFEVLLRDRRLEYQEALLRGEDPEKCVQALQKAEQALFDDFAFVAECCLLVAFGKFQSIVYRTFLRFGGQWYICGSHEVLYYIRDIFGDRISSMARDCY